MAMDKPITIQKQNPETELWIDVYHLHAEINKSAKDDEYLGAGSSQSKRNLIFKVNYFAAIEDIDLNRQYYRIWYRNAAYAITDIDDYMLQHLIVKINGVSY